MGATASLITSLTIVYSTVYSGADQRKHQSSASLDFVRGIHRGRAGEFPAQRASNVENVSIWWRHHGYKTVIPFSQVDYKHIRNYDTCGAVRKIWNTRGDTYVCQNGKIIQVQKIHLF